MAQKKKLQVFVSSTYTDLLEERQAAVEAILTAGHIPAGMELFAAGDETQMNVIKRWINESDIFLLILGGRYGSIDVKSKKSYIQLEYEYAVKQKKPLFAIVISDAYLEEKVKKLGTKVIETDYPHKLREFRGSVLSRMVKFWSDPRDIKLSIVEALAEISSRSDLVGWIPGSEEINAGALAEEIARLTKENASLRERIEKLSGGTTTYNGLTFEQMYELLTSSQAIIPDLSKLGEQNIQNLQEVAELFGDAEPRLLHAFWQLSSHFAHGAEFDYDQIVDIAIATKLQEFGLLEVRERKDVRGHNINEFVLTSDARRFLLRLRLEKGSERAESYILPLQQ